MAKLSGIPLTQCPTCKSKDPEEPGVYRYLGKEYCCNCEMQMRLRRHYLVAGIPTQYMLLDFKKYSGNPKIKAAIAEYLEHWETVKAGGIGIEFSSKTLGTGKTFCATYVGKELVKRGERVYFTPFREVLSAYEKEVVNGIESRMRNATVLLLDEVIPPFNEKTSVFFSHKLEELIRHRTNYNLPTIMTTNMSEDELETQYPRPYSLLQAKQLRIQVEGDDYRLGNIGMENIELAMNGEVRPIT